MHKSDTMCVSESVCTVVCEGVWACVCAGVLLVLKDESYNKLLQQARGL